MHSEGQNSTSFPKPHNACQQGASNIHVYHKHVCFHSKRYNNVISFISHVRRSKGPWFYSGTKGCGLTGYVEFLYTMLSKISFFSSSNSHLTMFFPDNYLKRPVFFSLKSLTCENVFNETYLMRLIARSAQGFFFLVVVVGGGGGKLGEQGERGGGSIYIQPPSLDLLTVQPPSPLYPRPHSPPTPPPTLTYPLLRTTAGNFLVSTLDSAGLTERRNSTLSTPKHTKLAELSEYDHVFLFSLQGRLRVTNSLIRPHSIFPKNLDNMLVLCDKILFSNSLCFPRLTGNLFL